MAVRLSLRQAVALRLIPLRVCEPARAGTTADAAAAAEAVRRSSVDALGPSSAAHEGQREREQGQGVVLFRHSWTV